MKGKVVIASLCFVMVFIFSNCSVAPIPFEKDRDECSHCKMKISDLRFGTQFITKKGKNFKFDDLSCLLEFINEDHKLKSEIDAIYLSNYMNPNELVNGNEAILLEHKDLRSPMRGNIAACKTRSEADSIINKFAAKEISFNQILK